MKELKYYQDLYDSGLSLNKICKQCPEAKRFFLQKNLVMRNLREARALQPTYYWTNEQKEKHSKVMTKVVKDNPDTYNYENVCRRVSRFEYNGSYFHSSWEVIVAKFFDEQGIKWSRKTKPFPYIFEGKEKNYFPDFYLEDFNLYVEVKGYKVKKDEMKWAQFPEKLLILMGKEIKLIEEQKYIFNHCV